MNKKSENNLTKTYKEIGPYLGLGTQLAATITVMFFLGNWLDKKFDIEPILTIIFTIFGAFAGTYNFIITVIKIQKKKKVD